MADRKSTIRQSSFETFSSPFTAVFSSVGVQQNEKAVKHAFYNTAALVFVALSACAAVAVYYVLEAFLRPLLWAILCGAFLYPFKWKLTQVVRGFLRSLRESKTPLVVGALLVPFQLANKSSDFVGSFVIQKIRIFLFFCVSAAGLYGLYIIQPFDEILWILRGIGGVVHFLLDIFHNPYLVWSVVIGYAVILAFFWTPRSSNVIAFFSLPVWCIFLLHLVSITGPYRIPFFVLLVVCAIVGCVTGTSEEQDQVDGKEDWTSKRRSLIRGLSVAAAALGGTLSTADSNDSCDESRKESAPSETSPSPTTIPEDSKDGQDIVEGQALSTLQRRRPTKTKRRLTLLQKEEKLESKSKMYFVALFWGILLSRLWFHWDRMLLLLIPVVFYGLKQLLTHWASPIYSSTTCGFLLSWWSALKGWAEERRHALVPAPLEGLFKGVIKVDRIINNIMDHSMGNIISIFMVLFLIVAFILITVFLAVQVHHESAQLVSVSANLVNKVMTNNPQLVNWIQENTELKKTVESTVERAYMYGRKFIAAKVQSLFDDHHQNSTELQEQVLDLTDRIYHSWIIGGNISTTKNMSKNGTLTTVKPESNVTMIGISWKNVMNVFKVFDIRVSFSLIRENLGTLLSLLESVWMFLKGNISFAFNLVTTVLSVVFISGAYVLNTGLSMIVFVTALFYLLSASGEQYKPVEWFGKVTASGTSGFGDSAYGAIRGVFGAAVKMATFYGIYTWFTHTTFGVNIVFIPSALAAITGVVPFIGTYWAAAPAVLELWLVQGRGILAIVLAVCHFLPTYFVDVAIYSEISGGGHPYLTGLAVAGGIYCVGLEGAIIGPIVLCCLIVACNVYGSMIGENSPEPSDSTMAASDSQTNIEEVQYRSVINDQEVRPKAQTMS